MYFAKVYNLKAQQILLRNKEMEEFSSRVAPVAPVERSRLVGLDSVRPWMWCCWWRVIAVPEDSLRHTDFPSADNSVEPIKTIERPFVLLSGGGGMSCSCESTKGFFGGCHVIFLPKVPHITDFIALCENGCPAFLSLLKSSWMSIRLFQIELGDSWLLNKDLPEGWEELNTQGVSGDTTTSFPPRSVAH